MVESSEDGIEVNITKNSLISLVRRGGGMKIISYSPTNKIKIENIESIITLTIDRFQFNQKRIIKVGLRIHMYTFIA